MTRAPEYPLVDGRRVSQLREVLLREIAALAPDWRGAQESQGPDRAVVEIAARLAEEATKRLDKTPERDALAFLEMFDIAPPRPSAARGISVLVLKEDKTAPVLAPARTGIEIKTLAGGPAPFETTDDLRIQPARIDRLGTVDPAADRLELAPAQVTSFEPDLTARPDYSLATSADAGATVIAIEPPVGILPGDLLRITLTDADPVFVEVAEFSDNGLATLKTPLGADLPKGAVKTIERMTRLDAFAMPDRQGHGLYIGDEDVLNVKEPAEITLRLSPGSISSILSPNAVEFEIWGTREAPGESEDEPRWHRLVPLPGAGADLTLYKAWTGSVDALKLGDKESRWIRIRPLNPLIPENGAHPLTGEAAALEQVTLGVVTEEPGGFTGETVSQVAYNGTPLPLTTSFLPFGSEPRRFDTFALAAPEAFTKPGGTATLTFALMDATLASISATHRLDTKRHAYGIGRNGRLQVMDLTGDRTLWREAGGPPKEEGSKVTLPLDPSVGVAAYARSIAPSPALVVFSLAPLALFDFVPTQDVVIARTADGGLVSGLIEVARASQASAEASVKVVSWANLPDLPKGALDDDEQPALSAIPVPRPDQLNDGLLLAASSGGIHSLRLHEDGGARTDWRPVALPEQCKLPKDPVLIFVDGSVDDFLDASDQQGAYLTLDDRGELWILRIHIHDDSSPPSWRRLEDSDGHPLRLAAGARPAALRLKRDSNDLLLVAALPSGQTDVNLWEFDLGTEITFDQQRTGPAIDASAILRLVQSPLGDSDDGPHLLAYQNQPGVGLVLEWAPDKEGEPKIWTNELPGYLALAGPPAKASAAIFGPVPPHDGGLIAFGAESQTLVRLSNPSAAGALEAHALSPGFSAPELSWEYFNGEGWKRLDRGFRDTTADFSRSGKVAFTVPRDLSLVEIGGQEDHWIRVRLVGGDYGKPVYKVISNPPEQKVVVDTSDLRPPEVARVTARVSLPPHHLPELVIARNNLRDLDQSAANRLDGARFAMFEGAFAAPLGALGSRSILLGLTRPLEPGSASLLVRALEQDRTARLILETLGPDNNWSPAPLADADPTAGLHRSGLLRFTVTDRPAQILLFGKPLHWLRLRVEDLADWAPQITGIWLNGVDIVQAETVRQELLASSAGEPNLELTLQRPPVLANSLELRIRERLSEEDTDALNAAARERAPAPVLDGVLNLPGKWVLWREVDSLQDQGVARVYLLNSDGRLRFGDDRNGRIPPAGRDNIRAFTYLSGGQRVETAPFAEADLSGSVEGVEMVLAPGPIAGGTRPPSPAELVARMPEVLRHAGHALSLADLEAMAHDADGEIVQARAFAPDEPGGKVRLIVLARGEGRAPAYSLAQRENLRRVLSAKMSDAYPETCLEVRSAAFVPVEVTVALIARPGKLAELETQAGTRLRTFLHAALGGPENNGWPPGRALWPTDIRRALSTLDALDRVEGVEIVMPEARSLGQVLPHEVIATASSRDVKILVEGEAEA